MIHKKIKVHLLHVVKKPIGTFIVAFTLILSTSLIGCRPGDLVKATISYQPGEYAPLLATPTNGPVNAAPSTLTGTVPQTQPAE